MEATLKLDRNMRIIGTNHAGLETIFDTSPAVGGENTASTPMEIMLQSMAACSFMDVVSILRKKRKDIAAMNIKIEAVRGPEHPKKFTDVHLVYELTSSDAETKDLERAIELSQDKYCGASAMFKDSGCKVTHEAVINRP